MSDGDLGLGSALGTEFNYADRGTLYLIHTLEAENPDAFNNGRLGRSTLGVRNRFSDSVSVFAERRYHSGTGPTGYTQHFGIDFTPFEQWLYAVTYETGALTDPRGGDVERAATTATVSYSDDVKRLTTTLEYRNDDNPITGKLEVVGGRGLASYRLNASTRITLKAHASRTESAVNPAFDADFAEYVVAGAYRPTGHDRLNVLAKYIYLQDLPSPAQVSALEVPIDFAQRSHVFSVDATLQITRRLILGAKYAYRIGELRPSRDESAAWFDSRSDFVAVRIDLHFPERWDFLIEARKLSVAQANDERAGALVALYRHVGNHAKVGAGYNFTDFSDDLTNLDYRAKGAFINIVGIL